MIPSAESIQRGQKLAGDFIEQTQGKPITLALSRLGILAALAIHEAIEAERWACERAINPQKWIFNVPDDDYKRGFIDGLRAAHGRIAARLEFQSDHPSDPMSNPLSQEEP